MFQRLHDKSSFISLAALALASTAGCSVANEGQTVDQSPPVASPEQNLPENMRQLTSFGERASWSPDGEMIAFMAKSFGDAFIVDVDSGELELLTHYPNDGYLRVQYLPSGNFLLVGARDFTDVRTTRYQDQELWYLHADSTEPAVALNEPLLEGVAISRTSPTIAWTVLNFQDPDIPQSEAVIYMAEVVEENGVAEVKNKREVLRTQVRDCAPEPQDFRNGDSELIYTCYQMPLASVFGVDVNTGEVTTYRDVQGEYNEAEGVYPDGDSVLVESSKDQAEDNSSYLDIWRLSLDGQGEMERLTRFGDYDNYKASNPVVSPDGAMIAFQSARRSDETGVGHGIILLEAE